MSKASVCGYFEKVPLVEEALAYVSQIQASTKILREQKRISCLEPFSAVIATYLMNTHASLTVLCRILEKRYGLKVHKSTLSRYIRSRPALSSLRPQHRVQTVAPEQQSC